MSTNQNEEWWDLYKVSMRELDPNKLPESIIAARSGYSKSAVRPRARYQAYAERHHMKDALRNLSLLERMKRDS